VREPGTGHVSWIDASGPGEAARYVTAWPPPADGADAAAPVASSKLAPLPVEDHGSIADRDGTTGAKGGATSLGVRFF
jgi:hypothetical protein